MKLSWLLPLVFGTLAFPLGVWLTRWQTPNGLPIEPVVQSHEQPSRSKATIRKPPQTPRPSLDEVLASEGLDQLRLLTLFLAEATLADLKELTHLPSPPETQGHGSEWRHADYAWKLILARWCELDAEGALQFVRDSRPRMPHLELWCFRAWSTVDPIAAMDSAIQQPDRFLAEVIDEVIRYDLEMATQLMNDHPANDAVRKAVLAEWGRKNLNEALARALGLPQHLQGETIASLLGGLARDNPTQALHLALEQENPVWREKALAEVLPELIETDPQLAEKHGMTLVLGPARYELVKKLAKKRVKDGRDVLVWAHLLEDPGERQAAFAAAFENLEFDSLTERYLFLKGLGLEYVLPNPREVSRRRNGASYRGGADLKNSFQRVLKELAERNPESALRAAAAIPPNVGNGSFHPKQDILIELSKSAVKQGHGEELQEMLDSVPNDWIKRQMWSEGLKVAPAAFFTNLATNQNRLDQLSESELEVFVSRWLKADTFAASEWVGQMEAGPAKDDAVNDLLRTLHRNPGRQDHEALFAWSQVIGDAEKREHAVRSSYESWKAVAPEEAREAVIQADLGERLRKTLLGEEGLP